MVGGMEGFEGMPASFVAYDGASSAEYLRSQSYNYSEPVPTYPNPEDIPFGSPAISQGTAQSYFEDGFPDSAHDRSSPEAPSIERGNRLLSFKASIPSVALVGLSMRQSSASLAAQLHGMFFLAESSRTETGEFTTSPPELTCYRRNLFQITGSVTLPRLLQHAVSESGESLPVVSQELTISASESVEGGPVKIISVPWKTPVGGAPASAEDKAEKEPSPIALDQSASKDVDSDFSVYPVSWKRLQFRVATANNGRRRELQQHFTVKLCVMATLDDGSKISLCEAYSGPVIVRGRSPRNFQQRKDVPLNGCGASVRKAMAAALPPPMPPPRERRSATMESMRLPNSAVENGIEGSGYAISPARYDSPVTTTVEWQQPPHAVATPISPYTAQEASSNMPYPVGSPLKRKFDDTNVTGQLASTQAGSFALRSSAPPLPLDRPRKAVRTRMNTVGGGDPVSSLVRQPGLQQSALPSPSFNFRPANIATGSAFFAGLDKATSPPPASADQVSEYFSTVEDWMPTAAPYYRPPHAMHGAHNVSPVTTVGGSVLTARGSYLGDMA